MVFELTPTLEARLRQVVTRLHLDNAGVSRWLLTILDPAVPSNGSASEEDLLRQVNAGFPPEWWDRCRALTARREAGTISPEDLATLAEMTEAAEVRYVERMEALAGLADLHGTVPAQLMRQRGLTPEPLAAA